MNSPFSEQARAAYPENDQPSLNDRLQTFKTKGLGFASFIKDKTVQAGTQIKQKSTEPDASGQSAYDRVRLATRGAADKVSTTAAVGGQWANVAFKRTWDTTAEGIRRLTGNSLVSVCKNETSSRPCPRLVLVCCTALVTRGLETESLFLEEASQELVQSLLGSFQEGAGAILPPTGVTPHVLANTIKQFLVTMPEPLLTYKLLPQLIQHGSQQPALANLVLAELPPANQCCLNLLLETFYRLCGNAAVNEMDAHTVATVMAPCLAWNPPPKPKVATLTHPNSAAQRQNACSSSMHIQRKMHVNLGPAFARTTTFEAYSIAWFCPCKSDAVDTALHYNKHAKHCIHGIAEVLLRSASTAYVTSTFSIPGMTSSPKAEQLTRTRSGRMVSIPPNLQTVAEGDETADGSPSSSLARIQLDDDELHAIVRVLEHLITNYKQLSEAPSSPLYKGPRP